MMCERGKGLPFMTSAQTEGSRNVSNLHANGINFADVERGGDDKKTIFWDVTYMERPALGKG